MFYKILVIQSKTEVLERSVILYYVILYVYGHTQGYIIRAAFKIVAASLEARS